MEREDGGRLIGLAGTQGTAGVAILDDLIHEFVHG